MLFNLQRSLRGVGAGVSVSEDEEEEEDETARGADLKID